MSKPIKRRCPQCGKMKSFRADQKTCGCPRPGATPKVDPLAGRYFRSTQDENGEYLLGRFISRVGLSTYLVSINELFEGKKSWSDKIVPLSAMSDWEVMDEETFDICLILRGMETQEQDGAAD